jgi:hypothetical protein
LIYTVFSLRAYADNIRFTFDFGSLKNADDITAGVLLFNNEIASVKAGRAVSVKLPREPSYNFAYTYSALNGKPVRINALPLYISSNKNDYTIHIPVPPESPSGEAKIRLKSNFGQSVRVWAEKIGTNGRRGYIGEFDSTLTRDKQNSVLYKSETLDFTIPAGVYRLEVRDTSGAVLRGYDEFYFPAAFERYILELDPDDYKKVEARHIPLALEHAINLDQEFKIMFTKPVIKETAAAKLIFYNKNREKIPVQLEWNKSGTVLSIKPNGYLLPETEYFISFTDLNVRDIRGNALSEIKEWNFKTNAKHPELQKVEKIVSAQYYNRQGVIAFEWEPVEDASGYTLYIYAGGGFLEEDMGKVQNGEFDCSKYLNHEYIEYRIVPYKIIEGKKAYSMEALDRKKEAVYFDESNKPYHTFYIAPPSSEHSLVSSSDFSKISEKVTKLLQKYDFKSNSKDAEYEIVIRAGMDSDKDGRFFIKKPYISIQFRSNSERHHFEGDIEEAESRDERQAEEWAIENIIDSLEEDFEKFMDSTF